MAQDQRADDLRMRKKFSAATADAVRRLKQLEVENAWLKKLVAERDLEILIMKEIAAKSSACRSSRAGVTFATTRWFRSAAPVRS